MRFHVEAEVSRPGGFHLSVAIDVDADALGIVGPSGSGKSTLLDAVAGIEPGARVKLDRTDLTRVPIDRRELGYVTQDPLLFPHLTVRENLLYGPRATGLGDLPDALGLSGLLDRRPRNLSGGERRRASLARAILSRPRALLLDEPFSGLDEARRRDAMSLLDRVRRAANLPMILVSHRADEIVGLTDRAIRIEEGRVVVSGPSASLLRSTETRIDNFLEGEVSGPGRARVNGVELHAMVPEGVSGRIRLGCYAHDVLLAKDVPGAISARNVFPVRVASLEPAGDAVLVRLDRPSMRALLTPDAAEALDLAQGAAATAILKATSIVYLGPA